MSARRRRSKLQRGVYRLPCLDRNGCELLFVITSEGRMAGKLERAKPGDWTVTARLYGYLDGYDPQPGRPVTPDVEVFDLVMARYSPPESRRRRPVRTAESVSAPIAAATDDGALFELLAQTGARMPLPEPRQNHSGPRPTGDAPSAGAAGESGTQA